VNLLLKSYVVSYNSLCWQWIFWATFSKGFVTETLF